LERLIPEFYINQKTISDVSVEEVSKDKDDLDTSSELSELKEEEKENLFDRLRTKNKFFNPNINEFTQNNNILPIIPTKNYIDNYKSGANTINKSQIFERRFDDNEIKNAAASKLFRIQNKSYSLVDNDPTILNIKKLKSKFEILNNDQNKKIEKVLGIDLFKYDKNKWQKKNLREVKFN